MEKNSLQGSLPTNTYDCSALQNKCIDIHRSEKTISLLHSSDFDGIKTSLTKDGFEHEMLPYLLARENGNEKLPLNADGSEIRLNNKITEQSYDGTYVYTISPEKENHRVILYIHGGAYTMNATPMHVTFCDRIATELNAEICFPLHTLAPQGTYREAFKLLHLLYRELSQKGKQVIVMGDSSGGGLALAFVEDLVQNGLVIPDQLVLFSPWLDVTMSNSEISEREKNDTFLSVDALIQCGKMWAGETDPRDYHISPKFGDVKDLPDTLIFVDSREMLYPDTKALWDRMQEENQNATLVVGQGLFHVFPIITALPESEQCIDIIRAFVK